MKERADAARNRAAVLRAASRLFDDAADPQHVSMDQIATAAGVGKGTLFRRFGDRSTLLLAVYNDRLTEMRTTMKAHAPTLGPDASPPERITALLEEIIVFKLRNRRLVVAAESAGAGSTSLYDTPHYTEIHGLLSELLSEMVWPHDVGWTAHALLATTRIDLIDHLVTDGGMSAERIITELRAYTERLLLGNADQQDEQSFPTAKVTPPAKPGLDA